jgi:predicted nucleic acid-binding protein
MPGPVTVDASVFVNAFNAAEAGHDLNKQLLALLQGQAVPIVVPTLVLPEVASTIS